MHDTTSHSSQTKSKYKLTPPTTFPKKLIFRDDLLEKLKHLKSHNKKLITIESLTGSGKSVFAQQYIQNSNLPSGWFHLGHEDHDPIVLFNGLVTLLQKTLPGFEGNDIASAFAENVVDRYKVTRLSKILAQEMNRVSSSGFTLVLDDLHMIDGSSESTELLLHLIAYTPSWIQLLFISRYSVKRILQIQTFDIPCLRIENSELNFSFEEGLQLFHSIFGLPVTIEQMQQIQEQTEGWITGLVLTALHWKTFEKNLPDRDNTTVLFNKSHFADFFIEDVLSDISDKDLQQLFQLVLLEEISQALICNVFGTQPGKQLLAHLIGKNYFLSCIDPDKKLYRFYHLFRESLLPVAERQLPGKTQKKTFQMAAQYHIGAQEPLIALRYAFRDNDIALCEEILEQYGFEILHQGQIKKLYQSLITVPPVTIKNSPWLSCYYGICLQDTLPVEAFPHLGRAQLLFSEQNNQQGLLLVNSQLIEFHVLIDGQFNLALNYLPALEELYLKQGYFPSLPFRLKILHALALGHCFVQADMQKVKNYDSLALRLSTENDLDDTTCSIRLIRAYRYGFFGNWRGCKEEVEASFPLMKNPRVSTLNKLLLQMLQVNLLEMCGDFHNYHEQKRALKQATDQDVVLQSVIGPFVYIWDIDSALAINDIDTASRLVARAEQSDREFSKPHMRSQLLHYKAFILALQNKKEQALQAREESFELRQHVGGNAFILLNHQILGAACGQLGLIAEAEQHFNEALQLSKQIGEEFQRAAIHAHRAWLLLQTKQEQECLLEVRNCLFFLKKGNYKHFFTFMPLVMEPLLHLALEHDIEPSYAKKLLAETLCKGVAKNGTPIPLLEFRFLGDQTISSGKNEPLHFQKFTEKERQLFTVLSSSPDLQVSHPSLAEQLWPDKAFDKQRSSLDVLISQTRKKLNPLVSPARAMDYLIVEQSMVKLRNCTIDILLFFLHAKHARRHLAQGKKWQAGNSFQSAFRLLNNHGVLGTHRDEVDILSEELEQEFLESAKAWATLLEEQDKAKEACRLLVQAFQRNRHDTEPARQLYDHHLRAGKIKQAQTVLADYKNAQTEFCSDQQEFEGAIEKFWQRDTTAPHFQT